MSDEPINLQEAREAKAAELEASLSPEDRLIRDAEQAAHEDLAAVVPDEAAQAESPGVVADPNNPNAGLPVEYINPLNMSMEEITSMYGAAQMQNTQLQGYTNMLRTEVLKLRGKLKIAEEQLAVKTATIRNLARRKVEGKA